MEVLGIELKLNLNKKKVIMNKIIIFREVRRKALFNIFKVQTLGIQIVDWYNFCRKIIDKFIQVFWTLLIITMRLQ